MKNKTCFFTGFMLLLFGVSLDAQYVTLEDKQFRLNGEDFYPKIINYHVNVVFDANNNSYFIAPCYAYDSTGAFEGTNKVECDSLFQRDFDFIAGMGFNGIRLYSFYPSYESASAQLVFRYKTLVNQDNGYLVLDPDNPIDTNMQIVLPFYDQLLYLAHNASIPDTNLNSPLKIIFILSGWGSFFGPYERSLYDDFFNLLSQRMDTVDYNQALFAYDLINEPCRVVKHKPEANDSVPTKEEACNMIDNWYSTIKSNDKKHLITIGIDGTSDLEYFDPSILKVDFYSLHVYPSWKTWEDRTDSLIQLRAWNRVSNHLYWMNQNCPKAWMVGETGFSATKYYGIIRGMNGTLEDQADFAEYSINAVKNCGGSGYSWGGFQDVNFTDQTSPNFRDNFIGLVERWYIPGEHSEKPASYYFDHLFYDPGYCPVCYSPLYDTAKIYYNPFAYPYYNAPHEKNGYVIDQDNNPIRDAFLFAKTCQDDNDTPRDVGDDSMDDHYTFTDSLGYFKLIAYDVTDTTSPDTIYYMVFAAAGSELKKYGIWVSVQFPPNGANYQLNQNIDKYSGYLSNQAIDSGEYKEYSGFYKMTATDFTVEEYASTDIYAEFQVHLGYGFTAKNGSNCRVFNSDTAFICSDFSWSDILISRYLSDYYSLKDHEIELIFESPNDEQSPRIFPNPTDGILNIDFENATGYDGGYVKVYDLYGRLVFSEFTNSLYFTLDFKEKPSSLYLIHLIFKDQIYYKRIILN